MCASTILLDSFIRTIPDFPQKGIQFKDITPLLNDAEAFKLCIETFSSHLSSLSFSAIVAVESRGFIFGSALAYAMGKRLVLVRKRNKLPAEVHSLEYDLEYGTDILEIHKDALHPKDNVLLIDDLLATGGTVGAVEKLIHLCGAKVYAIAFLIELCFLNGRKNLKCENIISLLKYD